MHQVVVHCEGGHVQFALLENRQLVEYYVEQPVSKQLAGNIYKGRVVNILPGMQAAFVNIGLEKNAFLYIDDVLPAHLEKVPQVKPSIAQLLKEGQELLVQIVKEPLGTKGARVTTHISLPGRWIVYMPAADYVGVSRKIQSGDERERLRVVGESIRHPGEGLIMRTVAEAESAEALEKDLKSLRTLWNDILRRREQLSGSGEVYRDLELTERLVRDLFTEQVEEWIVDDGDKTEKVRRLVSGISPVLAQRVKLYKDSVPLYERYQIKEQLEKALQHKIWLKSGGYINLDYTEALTVVDVNTGKFTGIADLEETVFITNLEAAEEIARLLRLRDIGGIIIVDFIDMEEERHRRQIVARLTEALQKDRTKSQVVGWTQLGLLELTRKKVRENLNELFFEACPVCKGSGRVRSNHYPAVKR